MRRLPAFLMALLLAVAGVAAAAPGRSSSGMDDPDRMDDDAMEGMDDQGDDDSGDADESGNATDRDGDEPDEDAEDSDRSGPGRDGRDAPRCRDEANETDRPCPREVKPSSICRRSDDSTRGRGNCQAVDEFQDRESRFISFAVDPDGRGLSNYRIGELEAIESLRLAAEDAQRLSVERHGAELRLRTTEAELRLHDNPSGLIRFKADDNTSVVLSFPDGVTVEEGGQGARITYADGREAFLLADNATWNGTVLTLSEFFSFHIPVRAQPQVHDDVAAPEALDIKVQDAIEERQVGARVTLRHAPEATLLAAEGEGPVLVEAYSDVDVDVELPQQATNATPIRVVVSSEDDVGKTIVLDVDPSLLASTALADLQLQYFDLTTVANVTVENRVEQFAKAASLEDVLDPMDDLGLPEYWVVQDENGLQVLVSVPHWSAHAITVASVVEFVSQPSVVVGVVAGVAGSVMAAVLMLWPRRKDD